MGPTGSNMAPVLEMAPARARGEQQREWHRRTSHLARDAKGADDVEIEIRFMTLILTVNGPESIWMLVDRRLSSKGRPPKDDARKVMFLETTDGVAILGYTGFGATALGTEPADWMSAVVRGRSLPLEQSLGALAEAMKNQIPRHIVQMPGYGGPAHHVIVPAFLGDEPRLYTIDLVFAPDRKTFRFRYTCHGCNTTTPSTPRTPRFGLGGTGGLYLDQDKKWVRSLLGMIRANDRGQVSLLAVADHLAKLNNEVHLGIPDAGLEGYHAGS